MRRKPKTPAHVTEIFGFQRKFARLREDEGGNVLLLTAMMVFVAAILGLFSLNTGRAIYNRILTQNAVDSAADTAALWQARGCNLIQHLNNTHYSVNRAAFVAESTALAACAAAVPLVPATKIPIVGPPLIPLALAACSGCTLAPVIDSGQEVFATFIVSFKNTIQFGIPLVSLWEANQVAKGSKADNVIEAVLQTGENLLGRLGLPSDIPVELPSWATAYAIPLRIDLDLGMTMKEGDSLPWKTPDWWTNLAPGFFEGGKFACTTLWPGDLGVYKAWFGRLPKPNPWGWQDSYHYGNPGYNTWMAGKTVEFERAGLTNLVWLTSQQSIDPEQIKAMYSGPASVNGKFLKIPPFLAFASSQVEGDPVVDRGPANAVGKLIPLYFPVGEGKSAEAFYIYH